MTPDRLGSGSWCDHTNYQIQDDQNDTANNKLVKDLYSNARFSLSKDQTANRDGLFPDQN